jgi:hypothetical protein
VSKANTGPGPRHVADTGVEGGGPGQPVVWV